ncbi:MAG: hypothetical protein K2J48_02095, partial [Muribaculaceae bacterium]|nr:hypothetical protein [Muribaculaceae bacterium]
LLAYAFCGSNPSSPTRHQLLHITTKFKAYPGGLAFLFLLKIDIFSNAWEGIAPQSRYVGKFTERKDYLFIT